MGSRVHVLGPGMHWALIGPFDPYLPGTLHGCSRSLLGWSRAVPSRLGPIYSYRHKTLYRLAHGRSYDVIGGSLRWAFLRPDVLGSSSSWLASCRVHVSTERCLSPLLDVIPGGQAPWTFCRVTFWNDVWRVPGPCHFNKAPCPTHRSSSPVY